jgi:4-amino-4-deoxy-L-arabinose transferase-like glycosyltransferase
VTEERKQGRFLLLVFGSALVIGTTIRLWYLSKAPAWQLDEPVYYRISANLQKGVLSEHSLYGVPREPFLYQPPFYFLMLARWFDLVGASILHARVLGVALTALMQVALFRLLWKIHGLRLAVFAVVPVIFDAWLLYIERVSYIENALMLLIVIALLLYQRALERPSWQRFALAGLAVGCAVIFKQTGAYVLVAVLVMWLITRRDHRGHIVLIAVAAGVIATYLIAMTSIYDTAGHSYFLDQSFLQIRRVLGLKKSGGTLTSPIRALHLLVSQYRYFVPSGIPALAALVIAVRRSWQAFRQRRWAPVRANALLYSWLVGGIVIFGVSNLKFPQYFALVLVPAYCYLWTEFARWEWPSIRKIVVMGLAVSAGVVSFGLAAYAFRTNSLAEVQSYAATQIPRSAIVVTEEGIGDLIDQRWCAVEKATECDGVASYAITWRTYLQSSGKVGDPAFLALMTDAVPVKSFSSPVGTATVWKLRTIQ